MDFFGIGLGEILFILVLAVILMGPDKISGFARSLGQILRKIRSASASFMASITKEPETSKKELPSSAPKAPKTIETPPSTGTQPDSTIATKPPDREGHRQPNE